jgi:membrane peptidoglycan carboxypeptidase
MVEMGYITREQADEAKTIDIIEAIQPEASQFENIKAPWFVLEVKTQLEAKYGLRTMRAGGFTITTTLDYRAQEYAEQAVDLGEENMYINGTDNATLVSIDVETSQVIAMVGSVDWNTPGYGQVNAATSLLEPASSIKPLLDYAPLFTEREGRNWGPGSILADEDINALYCAGYIGKCSIKNASGGTYGAVTVREALAMSLNRPAVKALYINGIANSLEVLHALGNVSYCAHGENAGLSMAIGGGCAVRPVEHANAYASIARGGAYKDIAYWLEVKNSSGDVIDAWEDAEGKQIVDPQIAFMISDILHDVNARRRVFGTLATSPGFVVPDVWTAVKTGTSENGNGKAKDSWFVSYSPALVTVVWNGNHDGTVMKTSSYAVTSRIIAAFVENVHKNVYGPDGKWQPSDIIERPAGIQTLTVNGKTDIWPSWYNDKTSGVERFDLAIDTVSLTLATECTPPFTRKDVTISKTIDPMTKNEIFAVSGYEGNDNYENRERILQAWRDNITDSIHSCSAAAKPSLSSAIATFYPSSDAYFLTVSASLGSASLNPYNQLVYYEVIAGDQVVGSGVNPSASFVTTACIPADATSATVRVRDAAGFVAEKTIAIP